MAISMFDAPPLTLDDSIRFGCFVVSITDDDVLEPTEHFTVAVKQVEADMSRLVITPNTSQVTILDDDGTQYPYRPC